MKVKLSLLIFFGAIRGTHTSLEVVNFLLMGREEHKNFLSSQSYAYFSFQVRGFFFPQRYVIVIHSIRAQVLQTRSPRVGMIGSTRKSSRQTLVMPKVLLFSRSLYLHALANPRTPPHHHHHQLTIQRFTERWAGPSPRWKMSQPTRLR